MIPVIIPAYRNPEQLTRCLAAVRAQTDLRVEHETVEFTRINDEDNVLYTKAINEGLRSFVFLPDVPFCLVLTQDCYLEPDCLFYLLAYAKENPKAGIICPAQFDAQGKTTWAGSLNAWPAGIHVTNQLSDFAGRPMKTYWANGACMLLRTEMIREIGLLDENMQFLCSDSDYSFTARSRGWDVLFVPDAQCEHTAGESGKVSADWLQEIKIRDLIYFTEKWPRSALFRRLAYEGPTVNDADIAEYLRILREKTNSAPQTDLPQAQVT